MEYVIDHETTYRYANQVTESYTVVHLQPRTDLRQYCTRYELEVHPSAPVFSYRDRFGNDVQQFAVLPEHNELRIVARSRVITVSGGSAVPHDVDRMRLDADPATPTFYDFLQESPFIAIDDRIRSVASGIDAPANDLAAFALAASHMIHETFVYQPGTTTVQTTVAEALAARTGVCQDYAHVLIALARSRGIPARYASGYIFNGATTLGAEASHAWAEVYLPPYGWVGLDPTNDRIVDDLFVLIAIGRDYSDVSPTRGLFRGPSAGTLSVTVAVDTAGDQQQQQQQ